MAANLPGIRAQAELDLSLLRQQQAQLNAILAEVGASFQRIPAARFSLDATGAQRAATASSAATAQMATAVERDARRAQAALDKANRDAANTAIQESARATAAISRDFDQRLAAADRVAKAAQVAADRTARQDAQAAAQATRAAQAAAAQAARVQDHAAAQAAQATERATHAGGAAGLGLGAGGAAIAKQLLDAGSAAADFEKAMSGVKAVLSPSELAQSGAALEALALSLGQQGLGFTAVQAAQGLEEMSKAGISATEQLAAAPSVLALAAAGNISVAESAAFAANAMTVFGKAGADIPAIVDQISGAAVATTADVKDLQLAFGQFGAVAKLSDQSVSDTVTAIALLAQAGIKGSDAGTSLRTMFLRLQPATVAAADAMRHYGILVGDTNRFVDSSTGRFKSAADVAQVLQETLGRLSDAERQMALETIFGSDAIRAGAVFSEQGAAGWRKLTAAIGETTAIGVARERLNNLRGDTQNLGAAWNELQITFGKQIEPNLRPFTQAVTGAITALQGLSPEAQKSLLIIAGGAAAFAATTGAILTFNAALAIAGVSLGVVVAAVGAVAVPVALVAAAVAALGVAWVNNWGDIQGTTTAAVARITADVDQIGRSVDAARTRLAALGTGVGAAAGAVGNVLGIDANAAAAAAQTAGEVAGRALTAGFRAAVPLGGAALNLEALIHGEADKAAVAAAEEGKRVGADFVDNVATAVVASGAAQTSTFGAAADALIAEFEGRGFSPDQAREAATLYMDALIAAIEAKRAEVDAAARATGEALTSGLAEAPPAADALTRAFHDLTLAKNDLNQALGFAGTDQAAIAALLEIKAATEGAGASVDQLADRSIAAAVIALRNQANEAQDAAEKIDLLRQAHDLLTGHLAAQETTARALGRTQGDAANQARQQAEAERQLGEAIQRVPLEAFNARAQQLIGATLPSLTQETGNLIQTLLVQGQTYQAVQIAAAAFGASQEDVQAILHGTGIEAATAAEHIKRLADTADPVAAANKAIDESAKAMLATLSAGLPAADRAWLQYVAARGSDRATLRALYQRMGGDLAAFDAASEAQQQRLIARTAAARASAEALASTGRPNAAPADHGIAEARVAEDRARTAARTAQDAALAADRRAGDRATADRDAAQHLAGVEATFRTAQANIAAQLQSALSEAAEARARVQADFARAAAREAQDFLRTRARQQRDFAQQDAESLRNFAESVGDLLTQQRDTARQAAQQLGDAVQAAAERVRDIFQQVSRQAADTARGIREQLIQARAFGNTPAVFGQPASLANAATPDTEKILAANRQVAEQAAQQQALLTNAQRARDDIDKQAADADKDIQKQMRDLAQQAGTQRDQMIQQLTRLIEGFQRGAFQTAQGRADQEADTRIARNRQEEDQVRALQAALAAADRTRSAALATARTADDDARRRRDEALAAAAEAERRLREARTREDEDLARAARRDREDRAREDTRRREDRARDLTFAHMGERLDHIDAVLTARTLPEVEQTFDLREAVFVEPATELLEIAARRLEERVAARTAG